jgi:hypothetical protein
MRREKSLEPSETILNLFMFPHQNVILRLETPSLPSAHPTFLPVFNKVGQDVWKEWDTFIETTASKLVKQLFQLLS